MNIADVSFHLFVNFIWNLIKEYPELDRNLINLIRLKLSGFWFPYPSRFSR